jgi:hypothetical protein
MAASRVELFKVKALGLSTSDAELVLGGNLLRLISKVRSHIRMPSTAPSALGSVPQYAVPTAPMSATPGFTLAAYSRSAA